MEEKEEEEDVFPGATKVSRSVYISSNAENVSFVPFPALFLFNDTFAVNPICELLW